MKYRSRSEIAAMIIDSARVGATKTKLMYQAYLSYSQLVEYLRYLQENDLLVREEGTQLYRPTEKGLKFLNKTTELNELTLVASSKNYYTANYSESHTPS